MHIHRLQPTRRRRIGRIWEELLSLRVHLECGTRGPTPCCSSAWATKARCGAIQRRRLLQGREGQVENSRAALLCLLFAPLWSHIYVRCLTCHCLFGNMSTFNQGVSKLDGLKRVVVVRGFSQAECLTVYRQLRGCRSGHGANALHEMKVSARESGAR